MKTLLNKKYFLTLAFIFSIGLIFAQTVPPPNPGPPGFPIDGGLLILGALALGYGLSEKK